MRNKADGLVESLCESNILSICTELCPSIVYISCFLLKSVLNSVNMFDFVPEKHIGVWAY